MAFVLYFFFIYPFALLALALNAPALWIAATVVFFGLLLGFDGRMRARTIRELQARELKPTNSRVQSILRMVETYAPDDYRVNARIRVFRYPNAEPELRLWASSKWKFDLFVSEGFFDRSQESDWRHFLQGWSTLKWTAVRRQNRLRALKSLFEQWKGPPGALRHWWVAFCLYPLERVLKISDV